VAHYHARPSLSGDYLAFGSNRTGERQLYVMDESNRAVRQLTQVAPGYGAMWAVWRPEGTE
jgi:Tol biopolymer transport system component